LRRSTLFPYTTLFRSVDKTVKGRDSILGFAAAEEFGTVNVQSGQIGPRSQPFVFVLDLHGLTGLRGQRFGFSGARLNAGLFIRRDRKSTRLNSSHDQI